MTMEKDDEKIMPAQDEIAWYQSQAKRDSSFKRSHKSHAEKNHRPTHSFPTGKLLKSVGFLLIVLLFGWNAWLYQDLHESKQLLHDYAHRMNQLEDRLSVTDEDVSESMQHVYANVRELDSEIRKLWDNVWKRSKEHLTAHDKQLEALVASISTVKQQQSNNHAQVAQLKASMVTDVQRLANMNVEIEAIREQLRQLSDDVAEIEGWVDSINGFRRQVNSEVALLKQQVGELEAE